MITSNKSERIAEKEEENREYRNDWMNGYRMMINQEIVLYNDET